MSSEINSKTEESEIVLHSFRRCPFAIRVRSVLEEKQIPYRVIEEDLSNPSSELLRLHPQGKVPVLLHRTSEGTKVLPESAIITEYLDEVFPAHPLRPLDSWGRAQVRLWTHFCDQVFKPDLDLYKYETDRLNTEEKHQLQVRLSGHLVRLETELGEKPFILGDQFTLADVHLFPFFRQLSRAKADFEASFSVSKSMNWLNRILGRAAIQKALARGKS